MGATRRNADGAGFDKDGKCGNGCWLKLRREPPRQAPQMPIDSSSYLTLLP